MARREQLFSDLLVKRRLDVQVKTSISVLYINVTENLNSENLAKTDCNQFVVLVSIHASFEIFYNTNPNLIKS